MSQGQIVWIKKMIESNEENYQLFNSIINQDKVHWKRFGSSEEILKWLHNFNGETEINCALNLADNILYYNLEDIHSLYGYIMTNRIKLLLINEKFSSNLPSDLDNWYATYLRSKCIFVGFGRAGKSAPSMVYVFKQSHGISGLKYMDLSHFLLQPGDLTQIEKVILIDDFLGSGNQASAEWKQKVDENNDKCNSLNDIQKNNPHLGFIYIALAGCSDGKKRLETSHPITVVLGEELDERFRCFSDGSIVFKNAKLRATAKQIMTEKGKMLYKYPLGYDNMELAVAFHHNTPNNSLPVIWRRTEDRGWYPLFERFE